MDRNRTEIDENQKSQEWVWSLFTWRDSYDFEFHHREEVLISGVLVQNLFRIQLTASNLSWLVYFESLMEGKLRRKTDTICITMRSRANFQSRHESVAFVGKSIFSLWTLTCQTKVISYAVSVTKWFYQQIRYNSWQVKILCFLCRDDVWK